MKFKKEKWVKYMENRSTPPNYLTKALKIAMGLTKFSASSLLSAALDLFIFTIITDAFKGSPLFAATCIARMCSGLFNFLLNKNWVFKGGGIHSGAKYLALFILQMLASWGLVEAFSFLKVNITIIKAFVDVLLFVASFHIQKAFIFENSKQKKP
ncbi:MAG: GtrA family protein [Clostridiales bacterium]|jgi:putative flippase GtrA|nr:GtrA family protein [Clostridiales bacterium]